MMKFIEEVHSKMTQEKKLLQKQIERLSEQSKSAEDRDLASLSTAMCEIYKTLKRPTFAIRVALFFTILADLLVSIIVLIVYLFR